MISRGRALPSSVPVIARISKRAATRLLPWPKLSWTVMNGVVLASTDLSKVTVRWVGGALWSLRLAGDQPSWPRVSMTPSGRQSGCQESAVTLAISSRRLRLIWSPATGSALAVKAVRMKVPWPSMGFLRLFFRLGLADVSDLADGGGDAPARSGRVP